MLDTLMLIDASILSRRIYRNFRKDPVSPEILFKIIDAASYMPPTVTVRNTTGISGQAATVARPFFSNQPAYSRTTRHFGLPLTRPSSQTPLESLTRS